MFSRARSSGDAWRNFAIVLLSAMILVHLQCEKRDDATSFTATDLYGKWNCFKISTLWKSKPDSVVNSPVDSQSNFFRITADSIIDYVKTDSVPCYVKSSIPITFSTNPIDSVLLDSSLVIQAEQSTGGIILQYYYATSDSIRVYYLQKIDTPTTINVCDYGTMTFKPLSIGRSAEDSAPVRVEINKAVMTSQNAVSWF
jgi:hypothetical protein